MPGAPVPVLAEPTSNAKVPLFELPAPPASPVLISMEPVPQVDGLEHPAVCRLAPPLPACNAREVLLPEVILPIVVVDVLVVPTWTWPLVEVPVPPCRTRLPPIEVVPVWLDPRRVKDEPVPELVVESPGAIVRLAEVPALAVVISFVWPPCRVIIPVSVRLPEASKRRPPAEPLQGANTNPPFGVPLMEPR